MTVQRTPRPSSRSLFTSSAQSKAAPVTVGEQVVVNKRRDRTVVVAVVFACAVVKDGDDVAEAAAEAAALPRQMNWCH